jgi:hypothetical protein
VRVYLLFAQHVREEHITYVSVFCYVCTCVVTVGISCAVFGIITESVRAAPFLHHRH